MPSAPTDIADAKAAGADIIVLSVSDPVAPAGASGECMFKNVYLTVTNTMAITLTLTPVIDFVLQTTEAVDVVLSAEAARTTRRFEIGMSLPYNSDAFRSAMRGAWFQLQIQSDELAAGDLILEQIELEFEVVRETLQAEN